MTACSVLMSEIIKPHNHLESEMLASLCQVEGLRLQPQVARSDLLQRKGGEDLTKRREKKEQTNKKRKERGKKGRKKKKERKKETKKETKKEQKRRKKEEVGERNRKDGGKLCCHADLEVNKYCQRTRTASGKITRAEIIRGISKLRDLPLCRVSRAKVKNSEVQS